MSTETPNDFHDFNRFVAEQLADRTVDLSLEESVAAFRAYQSELARCREQLQPAIDELDSTGGSNLDVEAIIARGKQKLAEEGILD
jgi:hypothetical protein